MSAPDGYGAGAGMMPGMMGGMMGGMGGMQSMMYGRGGGYGVSQRGLGQGQGADCMSIRLVGMACERASE